MIPVLNYPLLTASYSNPQKEGQPDLNKELSNKGVNRMPKTPYANSPSKMFLKKAKVEATVLTSGTLADNSDCKRRINLLT